MPRLRTPAAAEYIGSTESTLEKKRLTGEGPIYSKIGRIVVYGTADLDDYLARHRRTSTSESGKPKGAGGRPRKDATAAQPPVGD